VLGHGDEEVGPALPPGAGVRQVDVFAHGRPVVAQRPGSLAGSGATLEDGHDLGVARGVDDEPAAAPVVLGVEAVLPARVEVLLEDPTEMLDRPGRGGQGHLGEEPVGEDGARRPLVVDDGRGTAARVEQAGRGGVDVAAMHQPVGEGLPEGGKQRVGTRDRGRGAQVAAGLVGGEVQGLGEEGAGAAFGELDSAAAPAWTGTRGGGDGGDQLGPGQQVGEGRDLPASRTAAAA